MESQKHDIKIDAFIMDAPATSGMTYVVTLMDVESVSN